MPDSTDPRSGGHAHRPGRSGWGGPGPWAAWGGPDPDLRVSTADREAVTQALCTHYADGRLTEGEFNERVAAAAAATTGRDLRPLLADLPPLGTPASVVRHRSHRHPLRWVVVAVLLAWAFSASAIHWAAGAAWAAGRPWGPPPFVPLLFVGVVIWLFLRRRAWHR